MKTSLAIFSVHYQFAHRRYGMRREIAHRGYESRALLSEFYRVGLYTPGSWPACFIYRTTEAEEELLLVADSAPDRRDRGPDGSSSAHIFAADRHSGPT